MRVLGFGTYDRARHPRVAILLAGLADRGHEVVELNRTWRFGTAERVAGLTRPWRLLTPVLRLLRCWAGLAADRFRSRRPDVVVVGYLGQFDVLLARVLWPRTTIVLDMLLFGADTARDRGVSGGPVLRVLDALDRLAVAAADVVVVDTEEHRQLLGRSAGKGVVAAVGAEQAWFDAGAARPEPRDDAPLQVVFFGSFVPLQGARAIAEGVAAAVASAPVRVTMIGHGQDLDAAHAALAGAPADAVSWIDWVEADALPAVVAAHEVGIGILGSTPKGRRVVPNKAYQTAAAGLALVTSDTAPQRRAFGDAAVFVPPGDGAALGAALVELAGDRERVRRLAAAARAEAEASMTPRAVVSALESELVRRRGS